MKKYMYFAALAVAATFTSCSNDEVVPSVSTDGLEPIVLGASQGVTTVTTRGTGTVGSTEDAANKFQFEDIFVLMTNIPTDEETAWGFTTAGGQNGSSLGTQFDNTFFCRPAASTTNVASLDYLSDLGTKYTDIPGGTKGAQKYYPITGSSDFFAYYVDDAAKPKDLVKNADNTMTLPFEMNGSQDIMVGKASSYTSTGVRGYSAKTSRDNNISDPVIEMKHALSRLTFEIENGHNNAAGVQIDGIEVKSLSKGTLTCAYLSDDEKDIASLIKWDENSKATFKLMRAPEESDNVEGETPFWAPSLTLGKPSLVNFSPVILTGVKGTKKSIGEAMFVAPTDQVYDMNLLMTHTVTTGVVAGQPTTATETATIPLKIVAPQKTEGKFKPGYSYHVKITVYGLSEVTLSASVEAWKTTDPINIDTAD